MQHHSPASVAATAGVSVALRICPKKVGHPCHSNIRQITTFILVHELAFGPGLLTPPVFIPFSVLFIICVLRKQNSLMIWEKRSSRQILPGGSVCPSSPSSEPSFSLPLVSEQKMAFLLCTPHVQWFHMNKNLTDWTLSSCALPLPSANAHQPHAHATDHAGAWDTTAAGTTFALQSTSRNEPLLYSFPIARRQSPPPGIQAAFHHTGVGGRGRSPFII